MDRVTTSTQETAGRELSERAQRVMPGGVSSPVRAWKAVGGAPGRYTFHPSCHLTRELGVRGTAETLLDHIPGAERLSLPESEACCGFGGLFAVKMPAISAAMMQRKLDHIAASGAETCVVCDASCMMHLNGGSIKQGKKATVRHLAEVLAE